MIDSDIQTKPDPLFAGVDVGGTSIKIGLISGAGQVVSETTLPTHPERPPGEALDRVKQQFDASPHAGRIAAVGLGTPGTMNIAEGIILEPPNLPAWQNYRIKSELAQRLMLPVVYANDANAAAYGEFWIGAGHEAKSSVLLTLGTGVGSGIVIDGQLLQGATGNAAEGGHIAVEFGEQARICSCGRPGHLEAYASATAVSQRAVQCAEANPQSRLGKMLTENRSLTALDVFDAAESSDPLAMQLIDETAVYLGRGISALVLIIDPEIVILGGAMTFGGNASAVGRGFLDRLKNEVGRAIFDRIADNLQIEFASLGSSAGWIGAAGLAKRFYDQSLN